MVGNAHPTENHRYLNLCSGSTRHNWRNYYPTLSFYLRSSVDNTSFTLLSAAFALSAVCNIVGWALPDGVQLTGMPGWWAMAHPTENHRYLNLCSRSTRYNWRNRCLALSYSSFLVDILSMMSSGNFSSSACFIRKRNCCSRSGISCCTTSSTIELRVIGETSAMA
jgi:hypothetical protein